MHERGNSFLRRLDRFLGIPLIFLLGLLKRRRKAAICIHSIALLKTAAIGDTILLSAIIQDLQAAYPEAAITLFTGASNAEAAKLIKGTAVICLPITRPFLALRLIRKKSFDVWIDCDAWPRINALFSFFARASCKIGFKTMAQARHYGYDHPILHSNVHELDNLRQLLRPLGIKAFHEPQITVPQTEKTNTIVLHLFAGGSRAYLKEWPLKNWLELAKALSERGYQIALTGSKKDASRLPPIVGAYMAAGALSLQETAELLASAYAVISVDTGIMHLAAALGCRVIALHGPTSPKRWGGVGPRVIALSSQEHTPCLHLGFERKCAENTCMQKITVSQVLAVLDGQLEELARG